MRILVLLLAVFMAGCGGNIITETTVDGVTTKVKRPAAGADNGERTEKMYKFLYSVCGGVRNVFEDKPTPVVETEPEKLTSAASVAKYFSEAMVAQANSNATMFCMVMIPQAAKALGPGLSYAEYRLALHRIYGGSVLPTLIGAIPAYAALLGVGNGIYGAGGGQVGDNYIQNIGPQRITSTSSKSGGGISAKVFSDGDGAGPPGSSSSSTTSSSGDNDGDFNFTNSQFVNGKENVTFEGVTDATGATGNAKPVDFNDALTGEKTDTSDDNNCLVFPNSEGCTN